MIAALTLSAVLIATTPASLAPGHAGRVSDARAHAPRSESAPPPVANTRRPDDAEVLEATQRQTFRYFWEFAHPVSGLARERSNVTPEYGNEVVTTGGSGFGVMAIVVATERGWITRAQALERLDRITGFLARADRFHGVFPHWMNGASGRTIPFSPEDDGGDIVETAYLFEGLLMARQYFDRPDPAETALRIRIDTMWRAVEWDWHRKGGRQALWWNWSPRHGFAIDAQVAGWNEALITYVLAAGSPTHPIDAATYHHGWARDGAIRNGRRYEGIVLPLGPGGGGPLFFEHYSFLGLDPRGLADRYADYWTQCVNHTLIQRAYAIRNPKRFKGYGADCWGMTSCDVPDGYSGHSPTEDDGVIAPTAALSSFPYTPTYSMQALRHFRVVLDGRVWGEYGFADSFSETRNWVAPSCLAIDQGPIIVMIENYRTRLPWKLFMGCPEVQLGLRRLGFSSPYLR